METQTDPPSPTSRMSSEQESPQKIRTAQVFFFVGNAVRYPINLVPKPGA